MCKMCSAGNDECRIAASACERITHQMGVYCTNGETCVHNMCAQRLPPVAPRWVSCRDHNPRRCSKRRMDESIKILGQLFSLYTHIVMQKRGDCACLSCTIDVIFFNAIDDM